MIKLGDKVRESITGFEGIATARCEYLWGCITYEVKAQSVTDDGKIIGFWFDEDRLETIEEEEKTASTGRPTGGPAGTMPSASHPPSSE